MEDDISTDALGIPPMPSEGKDHLDKNTSKDEEQFSEKDQQEQNNYLPPSNVKRSYSSQQDLHTLSASETEGLDSSTETQPKRKENEYYLNEPEDKRLTEETTGESTLQTIEKKETSYLFRSECHGDVCGIVDKMVTRQKELCLPPKPPLDWRLNVLLDQIASNVDKTEMERIKLMFAGPGGIGKKTIEDCKTSISFFIILKQRGYISRDNILYLNKILYTLGREDLIRKTVQYCREEDDVICYYSSEGQPELGRRQIKIHVKADVQKYDRGQLEELRNVTARIVCIPAEEIEISAVEPGSSFLITFTMPVMYVDILKDLLKRKVILRPFTVLDVDIIIIDNKHYDISGHHAVVKESPQCREIMNVYQQLEAKRKELEKMEIINLNCQEELFNVRNELERKKSSANAIESLERENSKLTTKCSMLQTMTLTHFMADSSLENFQLLLEEAASKRQDMELIKKIINANTEVVTACHRKRNYLEQKENLIKIEKNKVLDFQLRHDLVSGVKTVEDVLLEKYNLFLQGHRLSINPTATKALKKVSETISGEKRMALINMYTWTDDDVIKECIDKDEGLLLLCLEYKEATMANKQIGTSEMLDRFGKMIALDLKNAFNSIVTQFKDEEYNKQLIQQLEQDLKSPRDVIFMFAEKLSFGNVKLNLPSLNLIIQKGRGLYHFLNENERMELSIMLESQDIDALRICIEKDKRLLIPGLMFGEMKRLKTIKPPENVLHDIQRKLKRRDLVMLYSHLKDSEEEQLKQIQDFEDKRSKEPMLFHDLKFKRKTAEEVLKVKLTDYTLKLVGDVNPGPHFAALASLLREISAKFSEKESNKLLQEHQWDVNDVVKACIQDDGTLLVQGLWQKEMENVQTIPEAGQFILSLCKRVDRVDIYNLYKESEPAILLNENLVHRMMGTVFECIENKPGLQPARRRNKENSDGSGATCASGPNDVN